MFKDKRFPPKCRRRSQPYSVNTYTKPGGLIFHHCGENWTQGAGDWDRFSPCLPLGRKGQKELIAANCAFLHIRNPIAAKPSPSRPHSKRLLSGIVNYVPDFLRHPRGSIKAVYRHVGHSLSLCLVWSSLKLFSGFFLSMSRFRKSVGGEGSFVP